MLLIGDVHGKHAQYLKLLEGHKESIQLGDMGFGYNHMKKLDKGHRFIKGNHDNYNIESLNALGDFGLYKNYFFVRGAFSPDAYLRKEGVDWWRDEELTYSQMYQAFSLYSQVKPDIMLSHDCPQLVANEQFDISDHSSTRMGLQFMLECHKPRLWVFGHHHIHRDFMLGGTRFVCLAELETLKLKEI